MCESCLKPGPAGPGADDSEALGGAAQEGADEHPAAGPRDAAGRVHPGGAWVAARCGAGERAAATRAVRGGLPIVVFPEGTRSLDGEVIALQEGPVLSCAGDRGADCSVAVWGTERCLPKGKTLITPGVVEVRLLRPIDPAGYATREELMAAVHAAIAEALPARMRPLGSGARAVAAG